MEGRTDERKTGHIYRTLLKQVQQKSEYQDFDFDFLILKLSEKSDSRRDRVISATR